MKRLTGVFSFVLFFLLLSHAPAHAATIYNFDASNVYWNPSTKILDFDLSNLQGPSIPWNDVIVVVYDNSTGLYTALPNGQVDLSSSCNDTHCAVDLPNSGYDSNTITNDPNAEVGIYIEQQATAIAWVSNQVFRWGSLLYGPIQLTPITGATLNLGDTYSYNGSFSDPNQLDPDSTATSWTATVDYGDGSGSQPLTLNGMNFSLNHQYTAYGNYTVTVTITDNVGVSNTATATVSIPVPPPSVGSISVSQNPVQVNTATTATASFTDSAGGSSDTASWNWGDGNTSTGTVSSGSVTDNHTYTTAGVYTVTLTVTNPTDSLSTTQTYQYVSAYQVTSSGKFAAAKEFSSPAGAYAANTSLTGTASIGLSYKYQGGGNNQFNLMFPSKNPVLTFNETNVSSLVISGSTATLEGSGTINGSGNYNFVVVGVNNGDIRIQITDPSNSNAVIYDTQPGAALTATPSTPITKGSGVTVHN